MAYIRLEIPSGRATIIQNDESLGHVLHGENEWDESEAERQVLAACAGYAALIAAGYDEATSRYGTRGDFEKANEIIEGWNLESLESWLGKSVAMMKEPGNVLAVGRIAQELLSRKTIYDELLYVLVALSDGDSTIEEFEQYLKYHYDPCLCMAKYYN